MDGRKPEVMEWHWGSATRFAEQNERNLLPCQIRPRNTEQQGDDASMKGTQKHFVDYSGQNECRKHNRDVEIAVAGPSRFTKQRFGHFRAELARTT